MGLVALTERYTSRFDPKTTQQFFSSKAVMEVFLDVTVSK